MFLKLVALGLYDYFQVRGLIGCMRLFKCLETCVIKWLTVVAMVIPGELEHL